MKYLLIDDLGRVKGTAYAIRGSHGQNVEYGTHDKDGVFHVTGTATLTKKSALTEFSRKDIRDQNFREWDVAITVITKKKG